MNRRLSTVAVIVSSVALIAVPQSTTAAPTARAADRDCSDFDNQRQAQNYFIDRGGPRRDPDRLDADANGVAVRVAALPCSRSRSRRPGSRPQPSPRKRAQTIRARVTSVIDGDTIRVRPLEATRRRRYVVRLVGIDTPEVYGGLECGGRRASAIIKRLATGRRVLLRTDLSQAAFDRYDRLLAYAKLRGGPDLALSQLRSGWRSVYVYGGEPFRRVRAYRRAQRSAGRAGMGVSGPVRRRLSQASLGKVSNPIARQLLCATLAERDTRGAVCARHRSQMRSFRQRGTVVSTNPDQNVAGRPS